MRIVLADHAEPGPKQRTESLSNGGVLAQHAPESATALEKAKRVRQTENVEKSLARVACFGACEKVFEELVLPDRLGTAGPVDELEFRDTAIGSEIEIAPRVACSQREVLDRFARFENPGKGKQDTNSVDCNVDLTRDSLDVNKSAQELGIDSLLVAEVLG